MGSNSVVVVVVFVGGVGGFVVEVFGVVGGGFVEGGVVDRRGLLLGVPVLSVLVLVILVVLLILW